MLTKLWCRGHTLHVSSLFSNVVIPFVDTLMKSTVSSSVGDFFLVDRVLATVLPKDPYNKFSWFITLWSIMCWGLLRASLVSLIASHKIC